MNDPERWPRVKEIFDAALARAPQERGAFIHGACPDDEVVRAEVKSLLAAHADAGGFAESPAIAALAHSVPEGEAAAALVPGVEFGPYQIIGPLDSGAMGEIYRARDNRLARDVAVKVLPAAFSADPERIARLEREARLLAALNHPHIATVHSLETSNGVCAVVMELIEGPTLAERLSSGTLTVSRALEIARQIADALEAAHDRGIVHRDLKPANIKLTANGSVKILDFGLAKEVGIAADPEFGSAAIRDGLIAGTPAYMSPEQARGERLDQRADIWAFGCVLYEMLARRCAFGRTTIAETLDAILECQPDWQELPPSVPGGVRRLLRRCLEPDPNRRLHHIADARIEIEDAATAVDETPVRSRRWPRRERLLAVLAAVFAVGSGVLFLRPGPGAPEPRVVDVTTPWTYDPQSFALSPDGRRVAFVGDYQGQPTLWVRPLDAAEGRPLPGTQGARRPFWSPDSRWIGFFAYTELKRIDTRGGAPQLLAEIIAGTAATWGAGGNILFSGIMSRTISPSTNGLLRVNVEGGASEIVTRPDARSTGHRYPQFLPDGRHFLFYADGAADVRGVYLGSLDSSDTTRLLPADSQGAFLAPDWLLFVRRGTLLGQRFDISRRSVVGDVVTVAESVASDPITGGAALSTSNANVFAYRSGRSSTQTAWFDRSGHQVTTLASLEGTGLSNPTVSPDGRRVIGERTINSETSLWLIDAGRQTKFARSADDTMTRYPIWSRSGDEVAYASVRPPSVKFMLRTADGVGEALFESPRTLVLSDWSQDGRYLLYFTPDPKTGTDIWVLPLDTRSPRSLVNTVANEMWGQFSPDGRWIAYQSNETGRFEIYVRPFPGSGAAIPVSTGGGVYTRWSRDGNELFYIAPDATMMSVPVRHTATTFSADVPVPLFKTRRVGGGVNVIGYGHQYDVAPDGRFLINVEPESNLRPITLVMNWRPPDR